MAIALRISTIDREHLQELYDRADVPRDELPYTPEFDRLCQEFDDRTFKNAHREQVFAAVTKYVRSSSVAARDLPPSPVSDDELATLRTLASRYMREGRLLPYSTEIDACRAEFERAAGRELCERDFWVALQHLRSPRRRRPVRVPKANVAPAQPATPSASC